jgi:hypothetical protein
MLPLPQKQETFLKTPRQPFPSLACYASDLESRLKFGSMEGHAQILYLEKVCVVYLCILNRTQHTQQRPTHKTPGGHTHILYLEQVSVLSVCVLFLTQYTC